MSTTKTLAAIAALATAALGVSQAADVSQYKAKGYAHTAYWSAPGVSAMMSVVQNAITDKGRSHSVMVQGNAIVSMPGTMVVYASTWEGMEGGAEPTNMAMRTPGSAWGSFRAMRMVFDTSGGFPRFVSATPGTISAYSTLMEPTLIENAYHNDGFTLTLPQLGMLFSVHESYGGKIGSHTWGWGGMAFEGDDGTGYVIVPNDSPVNSASWFGHMQSVDITVIKP